MRKISKSRADDDVVSSTNGSVVNDDQATDAEPPTDQNDKEVDSANESADQSIDANSDATPPKKSKKGKGKKRKSEKEDKEIEEEYEVFIDCTHLQILYLNIFLFLFRTKLFHMHYEPTTGQFYEHCYFSQSFILSILTMMSSSPSPLQIYVCMFKCS